MPEPKRKFIYFIRHGESEANAKKVHQGGRSLLTERGLRQAQIVAKRISNLPVDTILSSSYPRAKQTAEEIKKLTNHKIILSDLLVERIGPSRSIDEPKSDPYWKGVIDDIEKNYGNFDWRFEDAENGEDLMNRAKKALQFVVNRPEEHIVVVTHGFILRFMLTHVLGLEELRGDSLYKLFSSFVTNNTGITVVEYDESEENDSYWKLRAYNDHAHLADLVE